MISMKMNNVEQRLMVLEIDWGEEPRKMKESLEGFSGFCRKWVFGFDFYEEKGWTTKIGGFQGSIQLKNQVKMK